MTTLSIDPGANIGWALFNDRGEEIGRGVMRFEQFAHSLNYRPQVNPGRLIFTTRTNTAAPTYQVRRIVYESWFTSPDVALGGSQGPAQEVIGVLKYLALQAGIPTVPQRAALLSTAATHAGYTMPVTKSGNKKHLPDEDSAYLHGFYYFVNEGVIRPNQDALRATLG